MLREHDNIKLFFTWQKEEVPDMPKKGKYLWDMDFQVDQHGMIELRELVDKLESKYGADNLKGELNIWLPSCSMWMNVSYIV